MSSIRLRISPKNINVCREIADKLGITLKSTPKKNEYSPIVYLFHPSKAVQSILQLIHVLKVSQIRIVHVLVDEDSERTPLEIKNSVVYDLK